MRMIFNKNFITIWGKYLTNWGIYAYLTNGDMCDMGIWIGGLGKMITNPDNNGLYYPISFSNIPLLTTVINNSKIICG